VEDSLAQAATEGSNDAVRVVESVENGSGESAAEIESCRNAESDITSTAATHLWTKEDLPKLQYNPEKNHGTLVVVLRKEQEEFWQDLDLLGRLQQQQSTPKQRQLENQASGTMNSTKPLVEVIDSDCDVDDENKNNMDNTSSSSASGEVMKDLLSINETRPTYGLFQRFSNVFRDYAREGLVHEMLECPNPDELFACGEEGDDQHSEQLNRREMRLEMENEKFDSDRYLNDLCVEEEGDMIFDAAMMMVPHWISATVVASQNSEESVENITNRLDKLSTSETQSAFFTSEESHLLATLPSKNSNPVQLSVVEKRAALLTLTDILFAYAYDHRTTDGDPTVESSWTVMILSPSLAWLENYNPPYDTLVDVVRWSIRRSIIYPYLRSCTLAKNVVEDVSVIFKGGRRTIIRCLLQLHRIMEKSESHYLFNKLYVDPLIGWIQRCEENEVQEFGREMKELLNHPDLFDKQCFNLDLLELEESFFGCNGEEDFSSSEDDDDDDDSVHYESDSDSRGADEDTVGTADEDESSSCKESKKTEERLDGQSKSTITNHSAALLDENIGGGNSALHMKDIQLSSEGNGDDGEEKPFEKRLIEEA